MKQKKSKEQIEEEKQERRETIKAHKALDDLINRAKQKEAFIEDHKIQSDDYGIRYTKSNRNI